jgi:hypothetical protein
MKCTPQTLNTSFAITTSSAAPDFGESLNLYSIICQVIPTRRMSCFWPIKLSSRAELPSAWLDAATFKTKDARFPHTYLQAVDKLWGFTLMAST